MNRAVRSSVLVAASLGAVVAVASLRLTERGHNTALADSDPAGCFGGFPVAMIDAVAPPPVPQEGDDIQYIVGAGLPAPVSGVSCNATNVDVFVDVPPLDGQFERICTIDSLVSGGFGFCPGTVDTVVDPSAVDDRGFLVAQVRAIGDRNDRAGDCLVPRPADAGGPPTQCFDATNTIVLQTFVTPPEPTPTPAPSCGDVNGDGRVGVGDLVTVAQAAEREKRQDTRYDVDADGHVTNADIAIVAGRFGSTC